MGIFGYRHPSSEGSGNPILYMNWDGSLDLIRGNPDKYVESDKGKRVGECGGLTSRFYQDIKPLRKKALKKFLDNGEMTLKEYNEATRIYGIRQ